VPFAVLRHTNSERSGGKMAAASIPASGSLSWKGATGDWSNPASWNVLSGPDQAPGANDDATINALGNYVVTVTGRQAVHDLTLNAAGATLAVVGASLGEAGTLAVGGTFSGSSGTLDLTHGGLTFASSQSLDNLAISFISPISSLATAFTLGDNVV